MKNKIAAIVEAATVVSKVYMIVLLKILAVSLLLPRVARVVRTETAMAGTAVNLKSLVNTVATKSQTLSTAPTCSAPRMAPIMRAPTQKITCLTCFVIIISYVFIFGIL